MDAPGPSAASRQRVPLPQPSRGVVPCDFLPLLRVGDVPWHRVCVLLLLLLLLLALLLLALLLLLLALLLLLLVVRCCGPAAPKLPHSPNEEALARSSPGRLVALVHPVTDIAGCHLFVSTCDFFLPEFSWVLG